MVGQVGLPLPANGARILATGASRGARVLNGLRQTGAGGIAGPADEAYAAIRASTTDVAAIAAATGLKPQNIQRVKDHVFMQEHLLDRYVAQEIPATVGRFESNSNIAEAWARLQAGTHTAADLRFLRHETAEAWYMRL